VDTEWQWLRSTFGDHPEPVRSAASSVLAVQSSFYHSPVEEVRLDSRTRVGLCPSGMRRVDDAGEQGCANEALNH
jgi:hypothetical protein